MKVDGELARFGVEFVAGGTNGEEADGEVVGFENLVGGGGGGGER